jgi:indoleamine 2,3-dioxygenase
VKTNYVIKMLTEAKRLPPSISVPFLEVASHLGLPPIATYAGLNLWNFASLCPQKSLSEIKHLSVLHTFTGTEDESWFYLISVSMEARGADIIPTMLNAMDAVRGDEPQIVANSLIYFADALKEIGELLERMYERCDPEIFYHKIRPFLAGSKNMTHAGLPKGVFYDEGDGRGEWRCNSGGSNAQSSLIQFFDIVLGVEHSPTGSSRGTGARHGFLEVSSVDHFTLERI